MRTLVDHFRKIACHHCRIQRLGIILALLLIVLAFLATIQQSNREVRTCDLYHAQEPEHTLPRLLEVYRTLITEPSIPSGGPSVLVNYKIFRL